MDRFPYVGKLIEVYGVPSALVILSFLGTPYGEFLRTTLRLFFLCIEDCIVFPRISLDRILSLIDKLRSYLHDESIRCCDVYLLSSDISYIFLLLIGGK